MITSFKGAYYFLSNFYPCNVKYNGVMFMNSEAAFQAQKCPTRASEFSTLDPAKAKAKGRRITLRSDWEEVKDAIMYEIVKNKFTQNKKLKEALIATGDEYLEEGNTWGDTYWGVSRGKGKNKLGKILMQVRDELK